MVPPEILCLLQKGKFVHYVKNMTKFSTYIMCKINGQILPNGDKIENDNKKKKGCIHEKENTGSNNNSNDHVGWLR